MSAPYRLGYILPLALWHEVDNVYHAHSITLHKVCDAFANLLYDASTIVSTDKRVGSDEETGVRLLGIYRIESCCNYLRFQDDISTR